MSVHFVYRTPYDQPYGKYYRRFDHGDILSWFQDLLQRISGSKDEDIAMEAVIDFLGANVYGFWMIAERIFEEKKRLVPPRDFEQLVEFIRRHVYVNEVRFEAPHLLQVLTDDDDLDLAWYAFDDEFAARQPERSAYLLFQDFPLPANALKGEAPLSQLPPVRIFESGTGRRHRVYGAFSNQWSGGNLSLLGTNFEFEKVRTNTGAWCVNGIRLEELPSFLSSLTPHRGMPAELLLLRAFSSRNGKVQSIREMLSQLKEVPFQHLLIMQNEEVFDPESLLASDPDDARQALEEGVNRAIELINSGQASQWTFDPANSQLHLADHRAEISFLSDTWDTLHLYDHWVLFDDAWAGAHAPLAHSLINYSLNWYV